MLPALQAPVQSARSSHSNEHWEPPLPQFMSHFELSLHEIAQTAP
jgi:hypothetical protein